MKENGEVAVKNPNSAVVWHYDRFDQNGDGKTDFEEEFHRTISSPVIKDDLLFIPDMSGLFHCLDAKTGKVHWTYDLFASCWASPLIAGDKVYIGDEDGGVSVFHLSADPKLSLRQVKHIRNGKTFVDTEPIHGSVMTSSVYTTAIVAGGVLFIADRSHLFAIEADVEP